MHSGYCSFITLCLAVASSSASDRSPCLLRCKDDHMFQVQKALGDVTEVSSEFLFPIETILKSSNSLTNVTSRIDLNCKLNVDYHVCLMKCSSSPEQKLLVTGLKPWMYMCKTGTKPNLHSFLPCLYNQSRKLDDQCDEDMEKLKAAFASLMAVHSWHADNFRDLCQSMHAYDACYVKGVFYLCGQEAAFFLHGLASINNATILELFTFDKDLNKLLPRECFSEQNLSFQIKRDQISNTRSTLSDSEKFSSKEDEELNNFMDAWGPHKDCSPTFKLFVWLIVYCFCCLLFCCILI